MILFFPDVNVWVALSVIDHAHSEVAWKWIESLPSDSRLAFSRFTQLGILRLLTNPVVTGKHPLTLREAWTVYDTWAEDPRVEFYPEPRETEARFRGATKPFDPRAASRAVGDCWLVAFAAELGAALVTFDRTLFEFARKQGCAVVLPR
ncbi:MAG TPA: TA system VapC family ribonuclease toxin [Acidobacteriaceae bacterium]|jgi:hypothetical protein|nr:TA system VapC family ribonuclease toxin [Acidobacteriaceae bacterium]